MIQYLIYCLFFVIPCHQRNPYRNHPNQNLTKNDNYVSNQCKVPSRSKFVSYLIHLTAPRGGAEQPFIWHQIYRLRYTNRLAAVELHLPFNNAGWYWYAYPTERWSCKSRSNRSSPVSPSGTTTLTSTMVRLRQVEDLRVEINFTSDLI